MNNENRNKKTLTKRDKQTIRFMKWIRKYSGLWFLICTPDQEHMNNTMMKKLITMLAQEQFYEIIFVLLMVHRNARFMESFNGEMLLEMMISNWEGKVKDKEQMIKNFTNWLT